MAHTFVGELWEYAGEASWFFVTVPHDVADAIAHEAPAGPGFGSVPVRVAIDGTEWRTSLFPDKAAASFVLPVKRAVREARAIGPGDTVEVELVVDTDRP